MKIKLLIKIIYNTAAVISCVLFLFELNLKGLKMLPVWAVLQLLPGIILFSFLPWMLIRILINLESIESFKKFILIHKEYKKRGSMDKNIQISDKKILKLREYSE